MFCGLVTCEIVQTSKGSPTLITLQRFGMITPSVGLQRTGSKKLFTAGGTPRRLVDLRLVSFQSDGLVERTVTFRTLVTFPTLLCGWCIVVGLVLSVLSTVLDVSMDIVLTIEQGRVTFLQTLAV